MMPRRLDLDPSFLAQTRNYKNVQELPILPLEMHASFRKET